MRDTAAAASPGAATFLVVAGSTATARIDGISAAGAAPEVLAHTPSADLELAAFGGLLRAPAVPVSPTGCPTPAVVTRAACDLLGVEPRCVDAGLAEPTGAPTVTLGDEPGGDIRDAAPVPAAEDVFDPAREYGRALPGSDLVVGETIPGGTTTALGVLAALGERATVSSSLPENPLDLKRGVVDDGLAASGLARGDAAGDPALAVREMGDPVLAAVAGLAAGAADAGTRVTLAGGTQMAAAAALARHAGVDAPLSLATTAFVARDDSAAVRALAADLDLDVTVTDPGFDGRDHPAMAAFAAGEAKEGVGMGGALALLDRADVPMVRLRERVETLYDRLVDDPPAP
jgi:uncharacterized protein (TIGR00303 family)